MTPAQRALLDELTARARTGDAEALAALFGQLRPLLVRIAQREIGRSHAQLDAEDLASEVMLKLIERFRDGQGPIDGPVPYLARAIRNRVIDVRRAPASREVGADDFAALADAFERVEDDDEQRPVDVARDLAIVATAMRRLSRRQQDLLTAIAIDGLKPRDIAAVTGEAANTVAAAASRARRALRIEIRRAMLEAEGMEACEAHRAALAEEGTPVGSALEHLKDCPRCRRALARFAALPTLGLVLPLVVLTQMVGETASAHAAAAVSTSAADGARADGTVDAGAAGAARARMARVVAAIGLALLVVLGIVAAVVLVPEPTAPPSASAPTTAPAPSDASGEHGDAGSAAEPGATPTAGAATPEANPVTLAIDVVVGAGATTIAVDLRLSDGATVEAMLVTLPDSLRIVDSGGWSCPTTPGGGRCTPPTAHVDGVAIVVAAIVPGQRVAGEASVEAVVSSDGTTVAASSTGTIVVEP